MLAFSSTITNHDNQLQDLHVFFFGSPGSALSPGVKYFIKLPGVEKFLCFVFQFFKTNRSEPITLIIGASGGYREGTNQNACNYDCDIQ